jgi:hypothetical protein
MTHLPTISETLLCLHLLTSIDCGSSSSIKDGFKKIWMALLAYSSHSVMKIDVRFGFVYEFRM